MIPPFNNLVQYHPFYKENGHGITVTNAEIRMSQIRKLNDQNSELLQKIRLGKLKTSGMRFPNKFTRDLHDAQKTCEIQKMLIDKVLELEKDKSSSAELQVKMISELQRQISKLQGRLDSLKSEKRKVEEDLNKEKETTANMKFNLNNKIKIQKELRLATKRIEDQEKQLQKQRLLNFSKNRQHSELQMRQRMYQAKYSTKPDLQLHNVGQLKPPVVINNYPNLEQAMKNTKQITEYFQKIQIQVYGRIERQSKTLYIWLQKIIDKMNNILKFRLKKLRQSQISEDEISRAYKFLGKMQVNVSFQLENDDFPFEEMLQDFSTVVQSADENRILLQKLKAVNEAKALDRNLVGMAIDELRKFDGQLLKGLKRIMGEHQLLKKEYEKFIRPDLNGIEWIQNYKPEKTMEFRNLPTRILAEIRLILNMTKEKEILMKNSEMFQAKCVRDIEKQQQLVEAFIAQVQNPKTRQQRIQELAQEHQEQKSIIRNRIQQQQGFNIDDSSQDIQSRKKHLEFLVSKQIFLQKQQEARKEAQINQNFSQMPAIQTPSNPRNKLAQTSQNRKGFAETNQERELRQREELELQMKKLQVQKKNTNPQADIQI